MSSHRYWRLVGLRPAAGNAVELSEVQLLDDVSRVDAGIALTCSKAPVSGSLSGLQDDLAAGGVVWSDWRGLAFVWDMGTAVRVNNFLLGAGAVRSRFPLMASLEYSDDGTAWRPEVSATTILWPGAQMKTASESRYRWSRSASETRKIGNALDDYVTGAGDTMWVARGYHKAFLREAFRASGVLQVEFVAENYPGGSTCYSAFGLLQQTAELDANFAGVGVRGYDAQALKVTGTTLTGYGASYAAGDIIGLVANFDAGTMTWYKNGVSQGVSHTDIAGQVLSPGTGSRAFYSTAASVRAAPPFLYPVAGAQPWFEGRLIRQSWFAAAAFEDESLPTILLAGGARPTPPTVRIDQAHRLRKDFLLGGPAGQSIGRVRGQTLDYVAPTNKPYRARVRLVREVDGLVVREAWSDANGAYDFQNVDELQSYTVLAYYLDHGKRAVVSDGMTLANGKVELMP